MKRIKYIYDEWGETEFYFGIMFFFAASAAIWSVLNPQIFIERLIGVLVIIGFMFLLFCRPLRLKEKIIEDVKKMNVWTDKEKGVMGIRHTNVIKIEFDGKNTTMFFYDKPPITIPTKRIFKIYNGDLSEAKR